MSSYEVKCPCCDQVFFFNGCIGELIKSHSQKKRTGETLEHIEGKRLLRERLIRDRYIDLETECSGCFKFYSKRVTVTDTVEEEVVNGNCKFDVAIGRNPVLIGFEVRKTHIAREDNRRGVEWYEFNADDIISGVLLRDLRMPHSLCGGFCCYKADEYPPMSLVMCSVPPLNSVLQPNESAKHETQHNTSTGVLDYEEGHTDKTTIYDVSTLFDFAEDVPDIESGTVLSQICPTGPHYDQDMYMMNRDANPGSASFLLDFTWNEDRSNIRTEPKKLHIRSGSKGRCKSRRPKSIRTIGTSIRYREKNLPAPNEFGIKLGYYGIRLTRNKAITIAATIWNKTPTQCYRHRYFTGSYVDMDSVIELWNEFLSRKTCIRCGVSYDTRIMQPYCMVCKKEVGALRDERYSLQVEQTDRRSIRLLVESITSQLPRPGGEEQLHCGCPKEKGWVRRHTKIGRCCSHVGEQLLRIPFTCGVPSVAEYFSLVTIRT